MLLNWEFLLSTQANSREEFLYYKRVPNNNNNFQKVEVRN